MTIQNKRLCLILLGIVGSVFLWTGGLGVSRVFAGLPTDETLSYLLSSFGLLMISFVSSYAATHAN